MNTPVEVVQAAFDAMNLDDWGALADLCDPVSLRLFKQETIEQLTPATGKYEKSVDQILDPDCHDLAEEFGFFDSDEPLEEELFNITTLEQLHELDPARVFVRWIQAKLQHQRRLLERPDADWHASGEAASFRAAQVFSFVILGSLDDGPNLSHVIYRNNRDIPGTGLDIDRRADSADEEDNELGRILCARSYPFNALCRRQADGSWKLIASHSLYLVPTVELIDSA